MKDKEYHPIVDNVLEKLKDTGETNLPSKQHINDILLDLMLWGPYRYKNEQDNKIRALLDIVYEELLR